MNLKPKKQQLLGLLPNALVQTHGPRHGNARFLSFDDGPDPEYTPRLLDLLAESGAHASFFVVGRKAELHPAVVERIDALGFTIDLRDPAAFKPYLAREIATWVKIAKDADVQPEG